MSSDFAGARFKGDGLLVEWAQPMTVRAAERWKQSKSLRDEDQGHAGFYSSTAHKANARQAG